MNFDGRADKGCYAGLILLLAAAYFVTGKLGQMLAMPDGVASPVWPPSGIALAALILGGRRLWPGILLGALLVEFFLFSLPPFLCLFMALGVTAQALVCLALLHRFVGRTSFLERSLDVFKFAAITALGCFIGATAGAASLCAGNINQWSAFGGTWFIWWLGDMAGILLLTPLLVAWLMPCQSAKRLSSTNFWYVIEAVLCMALLIGFGIFIFLMPTNAIWHGCPLSFVITPFLLWAAFRLGQRGATLAMFFVAGLAVCGAVQGTGPFVRETVNISLVFLELFLVFTILTTLGIAATVNERHEAEAALRELNEELETRVQSRTAELASANATLTDEVTERQMTEDRLRTNEAMLRQFMEHTPAAVAVFDKQMRYLTFSRRWLTDFRLGDIDLVGRPHYEVFPEISEEWKAVHQRCLAGAAESCDEAPFLRLDGSLEWVRWDVRPWHSAPRQIGGIIIFTEVITQRKQMAEALRRSYDELEERVVQRTLELERANEELQSATQAADAANRAKSVFLSRVSHELRTPLNAILGFGQLLEVHDLDNEEREAVDHILRAGRHLLALINDVLDITRIEAGSMDFVLEPVNLYQITEETLSLIRHLAAKFGVTLINEVPPRCNWHLQADAQRLRQVLLNLLSNAVKYNHVGGQVTVFCDLTETDNDGPKKTTVRLSVRDTGVGLNEEEIVRLFMPFERLKAARLGVEGTGMGLVLSKSLIEGMGGTMNVTSTTDKGSTFWLELPLIAESDKEVTSTPALEKATIISAPAQPHAQNFVPTLLYIEDNLSNLELVRHMLNRHMEVCLLSATKGGEGLELARQHRLDLILLDLHLPDIMGDEVLRRLQADSHTCDIPVIILSADATPQQIERLLQAGARKYLTKPLNLQQLLTAIKAALPYPIQ